MLFLVDAASCNDAALAGFLVIVKRALTVIQILGPIICIVGLTLNLIKNAANPDEKKNKKNIFNSILALLILFFVPVIVNAVMALTGDSTNFSSCWNISSDVIDGSSRYIDDDTSKNNHPAPTPEEYQNGGSGSSSGTGGNTDNNSTPKNGLVLIGDSRTVQTYEYLSGDWGNHANYSSSGAHNFDSTIFVAETGKGLDWLKNTAIASAKSYFDNGNTVVIILGVNDIKTKNIASSYASYINSNVDKWTANGSKIYFSAVTPCNGKYEELNSYIDGFNASLEKSLSKKVGWIDTDTYIKSQGYKTVDGLHYDSDTTLKIYNYIKSKV